MAKGQDYVIRLQAENEQLKRKLVETRAKMRQHNSATKKIGKQVASNMAMLFGAGVIANVAASSIRKIAELEFAMDKVAAVSRASAEEVEMLTKNAKDLGARSQFTAIQIAQLQETLARLGYSTETITDMTDSARKLAQVSDSELAASADVLGKTLNAFNLTGEDSARVANTMAESFSMSALNLEQFGVGMSYAATAGKNAGFTLEEVTAMMGSLVDAGIEGSKAGTALRDIFSDLSVKGITLEEAFAEINGATDKNAKSFQLFGKTSMNAAVILAENTEKVNKLTNAFNDSNIELDNQVKIMEDNLLTDWKLFTSAIDGFIQKGGALNNFFRSFVQGSTDIVNALNNMNQEPVNEYFESLKNGGSTVEELKAKMGALEATVTANGRAATKQKEAIKGQVDAINEGLTKYQDYQRTLESANDILKEENITVKSLSQTLNQLKTDLEGVNIRTRGGRDAKIEYRNALVQQIDATVLAIDLLKQEKEEIDDVTINTNNATTATNRFIEAIEKMKGISSGSLTSASTPNSLHENPLQKQQIQFEESLEDRLKRLREVAQANGVGFTAENQELIERLDMQLKEMQSIVENGLANSITAFADGLGRGNLNNAFSGLFDVIGSGLQTLGKSLITFGVSMEAFKKAIKNPVVAIAAGAAAVAAGAAVKNAASNMASISSGGAGGGSGGTSRGGGSGGTTLGGFQSQNIQVEIQGKLTAETGMIVAELDNFRTRDVRRR